MEVKQTTLTCPSCNSKCVSTNHTDYRATPSTSRLCFYLVELTCQECVFSFFLEKPVVEKFYE